MAVCKVLYKTDFHHSYKSRDLIGIFTNKMEFEKTIRKMINSYLIAANDDVNEENKEDQINWHIGFFLDKKQTQGLPTFELVFEELETNKIF